VEILCVHCGTTLKEHARFCDNCGTLVPSLPFSLQSSKFPQSPHVTSVSGQNDITSVIKREEVVQSIPPRPTRSFTHEEPSSWVSQLDHTPRQRSKVPSKSLVVAAKPPDEEKQPQITELPTEALPVASPPQPEKRSDAPIRELRVNVWEPEETMISSASTTSSQSVEEESLDDLPTRPLIVSSPDKLSSGDSPSPSHKARQGHTDDVEQLDSVPPLGRIEVSSAAQPVKQASSLPHSLPSQLSASSSRLRRNRKLLVLTLLSAVVVVLVGSLGAWIILLQPFSVPNITQPQQSFKDSKLGISLLYPRSWTSQVDHSKATVYFYDSSHTGQTNIVVGGGSSTPTRSIQQQAGQLGMTAQKSEPSLTFAGTTWQRLQGNVQQEGASYTASLLVAVHNQDLYSIIFLAPQAIYTQEEQYVFASMRSSFQFLL
jgi:zinc-ribbon domain